MKRLCTDFCNEGINRGFQSGDLALEISDVAFPFPMCMLEISATVIIRVICIYNRSGRAVTLEIRMKQCIVVRHGSEY